MNDGVEVLVVGGGVQPPTLQTLRPAATRVRGVGREVGDLRHRHYAVPARIARTRNDARRQSASAHRRDLELAHGRRACQRYWLALIADPKRDGGSSFPALSKRGIDTKVVVKLSRLLPNIDHIRLAVRGRSSPRRSVRRRPLQWPTGWSK
jgi:hypothetical protein